MSKHCTNQRVLTAIGMTVIVFTLYGALAAIDESVVYGVSSSARPDADRLIWGLELSPDIRVRHAQVAIQPRQEPPADRTSDYMVGTVAVAIILPRCVGALCTESWTSAEVIQIKDEVQNALTWWEQKSAEINNGNSLVQFQIVTDPPLLTDTITEPINVPGGNSIALCGNEGVWINEVMANLGYNNYTDTVTAKNTYLNEVFDYNHHLRQVYSSDWAFVVFVADASNDAIHDPVDAGGEGMFRFTDCGGLLANPFGVAGYGWHTGPHMVMNNVNGYYGSHFMDGIAAMEIGHIFGAPDEWNSSYSCNDPETGKPSCNHPWGYLAWPNGNCNYDNTPNEQTCMLNDNQSLMRHPQETAPGTGIIGNTVNRYTRGHIGWWDSDDLSNGLPSNGNDLPDTIDTTPTITLAPYLPNPTTDRTPSYTGEARDIPFHTTNYTDYVDVTINTIMAVEYRIDGGPWHKATSTDGDFDSFYEEFVFTPLLCENATYFIEARAVNSINHTSLIVSDTLTVSSTAMCKYLYLPIVTKKQQF